MAVAHCLHSAAVTLHLMAPSLYNPVAGKREVASIALLNSVTLAVACRWDVVHLELCQRARHL